MAKKGNKKLLMVVGIGILAIVAFMMMRKKKQQGQVGGEQGATGGQAPPRPSACIETTESKGKGKGVYISIKGKRGSADRDRASDIFKKGTLVSVDGGEPTKIIKVWKDKNKQTGAVKLANGTSNGSSMCVVG